MAIEEWQDISTWTGDPKETAPARGTSTHEALTAAQLHGGASAEFLKNLDAGPIPPGKTVPGGITWGEVRQ